MFTIGNGGSAATASHIACDLANNVVRPPRRGFNALSLAENVATLSATANDHGYERVYANQLMSLGDPGDVLIAVSDTRLMDPATGGPLPTARPLFIRQDAGPSLTNQGPCQP